MNTGKTELGFGFWLLVVSGGIVGIVIWLTISAGNSSASAYEKESSREVALHCTTDMATQFHIHPMLKIVINGAAQTIPANVGISPTCMNSIHTHDATGIIHIEAPAKKDFTLGDFFAVWGKTFNQNQVLDHKTDSVRKIIVTVNRLPVATFENTIMQDRDEIEIRYN